MQGDTPRRGDHPQGERDFLAFDRVLDLIREAFLSMHGSFANEERWRWDTPVITFTWGNGYQISRNLNGLVLGGARPTGVEIESNAWRDVPEGRRLVRYWRNFPAGRTDSGSISSEAVEHLVQKAYSEVSSWSVEDLEKREVLESSKPHEG
jgi:hypothetical protein